MERTRPETKSDQAGQCPNRLKHGHKRAFISPLAEPCDQKERDDMSCRRWNRQEISIKGAESHRLESQSDISVDWGLRDISDKSNRIKWPEIIVFSCVPKTPRGDSLAIVHVSF